MSTSTTRQSRPERIPGSGLVWKRDPVTISDWVLHDSFSPKYQELARISPSPHRTRYRWTVYGRPNHTGSTHSLDLSKQEALQIVLTSYIDRHLAAIDRTIFM